MQESRRCGAFAAALVLIVVVGCGPVPPPGASPSPDEARSPAAAVGTPGPSTSSPGSTPAAYPRPSASATARADCPAPGTAVPLDELVAMPASCMPLEVSVAGWWDTRRERDLPDATSFGLVLREQLPPVDEEEEPDTGVVLPLDIRDLEMDTAGLEGGWADLRVEVRADSARDSGDPHCFWSVREDEPVSASLPPVLTCPRFAKVLAASSGEPPTGALDACPDPSRVIPVETFVRYPRACFGDTSVRIRGWFDTHYVIGGWEAPWELKPAWLWSMQIGPVPVLGATSNASDWENLDLHIRPGSTLDGAAGNRWVVLTGHFAREQEYATCRYVYPSEWYGNDNPAAGTLDDADARADCSRAFVAESATDSEPN